MSEKSNVVMIENSNSEACSRKENFQESYGQEAPCGPCLSACPAHTDQAPAPYSGYRRPADPSALGMLAYGTVFFASSLLTLGAGNVHTPNLVLVFAVFFGGISQTLVGIWHMYLGDLYPAVVFTTYGGFNFTYGALYLPALGLAEAYTVDGNSEEYVHAIGLFLAIWAVITLLFLVGGLRTTLPTEFTFGMTVLALTCLSANCWANIPALNTAGGAFGIVATFSSYYAAMSMIWTAEVTHPRIRLPLLLLAPSAPSMA